jgi:two-component system OmpR family response regulator
MDTGVSGLGDIDAGQFLRFADLVFDPAGHVVWDGKGREIPLTPGEFLLLEVFVRSPGRALSRDQLIACAYPGEHHVAARTVDTHVRNLRAKLAAAGAPVIETVHGVGYRCG